MNLNIWNRMSSDDMKRVLHKGRLRVLKHAVLTDNEVLGRGIASAISNMEVDE